MQHTVYNSQDIEATYMSTDESMKMWCSHTQILTGLLAIKKNEIMPFSATWMDLETIILNEIRQRKTSTI